MYDKFIDFCKIGNLNGIKEHIIMNKINIHSNNEEGFRWACTNGHLHIIKYLISLYKINQNYTKINIHADIEYGFRLALWNGHKHIIKYLINLYKNDPIYAKININANDEYLFIITCYYKQNNFIKYLLSCGFYSKNNKCIIIL